MKTQRSCRIGHSLSLSFLSVLLAQWLAGCGTSTPADQTPTPAASPTAAATPAPTVSGPAGLGAARSKTLDDAAEAYITARATGTAEQAKASLVATLTAAAGVSKVRASPDGQAVWVKFDNGKIAAIHVGEGFGAGGTYDPQVMGGNWRPAGGKAAAKAQPAPAKRAEATFVSAPHSRKVLLMSAAAEHLGGAELSLFSNLKDYLVGERNWSAADVAIKANAADEFATLSFDDFFRLGDYGAIVICANRIAKPVYPDMPDDFDPDWAEPTGYEYFTQVRAEQIFPEDMPEAWIDANLGGMGLLPEWDAGRIIVVEEVDAAAGTRRTYLYIRDDLWQERMADLPNSFVYLCGPHGWAARDLFNFRRAGDFLGWDGLIDTQVGLDGIFMLNLMALHGDPDTVTWQGGVIDTQFDGSTLRLWPGGTSDLYLPAWAGVQTRGAPAAAVSVSVEVSYADATVPLPDPRAIEDLPGVPKEFAELLAGEEATFTAKALDAGGAVLAEAETTLTLTAGGNNVSADFVKLEEITAEPAVLDAAAVNTSFITATIMEEPDRAAVGVSVRFHATAGTLIGQNPVTTDDDGKAAIRFQNTVIAGRDSTTVTAFVTAAVEGTSRAVSTEVKFCRFDLLRVYLTGSTNEDVLNDPATFHARNIITNIHYPDEGRLISGNAFNEDADYGPTRVYTTDRGSRVLIRFSYGHNGDDGQMGQAYLHVWNCDVHRVFSVPPFLVNWGDPIREVEVTVAE